MSRFFVMLILIAGCQRNGYIVVKVGSVAPLSQVAKLRGTVTHDKMARDFELARTPAVDIPPEQSFAIEVPPEVIGLLQLHLEAVDAAGNLLAEGDAEGLVQDGRLTVIFGEDSDGGIVRRDLAKADGDGGVADLAEPDDLGPDLAATPPCPNVMFMADHTGSMTTTIPDGGTKLQAEINAINTIVNEFGDRVPIGLVTYSATGAAQCAGVTIAPEPMIGNHGAIASRLAALTPGNTGNNDVALQQLQADTFFLQRAPSYAIMITDNAPNCPNPGASGSDPVSTAEAATAAMALAAAGAPVYVVGFNLIADPIPDPAALDTIAQAGGRPCSGPTCGGRQFYPVSDTASLVTTLRAILNQVAPVGSCAF